MRKLLNTFWFNILLIIGVCFALYFVFFASLSRITQHGEAVNVPEILGTDGNKALRQLQAAGFRISIDSTYDPTKKGLEVLDVQPAGGSQVKTGRTIFILLNKVNPPEVQMPNLVNLSFRSAKLLIESNKLILGDTLFKPDMAVGAVLEQSVGGQPIPAGKRVYQGTTIDLVIGSGYGNVEIKVPNVVNMTFAQAKMLLDSNNIFITDVWDGEIIDSNTAIIYFQMPSAKNEQDIPNRMFEGENLDIRLRQDPLTPEELKLSE